MTSPAAPDITVSIVSYNTCDLLRACLGSLEARRAAGEATLEVVVADNGSTDGSLEMIRNEFLWVRRVETGGNIGYGRANNLALADARGRYFFVLNSDTLVEPGTLARMRDYLNIHPKVGAVGGQLVLPDGTLQLSCAHDPSLWAVFREQTHLEKLLPQRWRTGSYAGSYGDCAEPREVDQVIGACLFARRAAWEQVGGFDPAYFMYFEDVDFCVRLRRAGWKAVFLPQARVRHHLGASSRERQTRAQMIVAYNRSRYDYFRRQSGSGRAQALKTLVLLGTGLRLTAWGFIALTRPAARAQVQLFREVWRQTRAIKPQGNATLS